MSIPEGGILRREYRAQEKHNLAANLQVAQLGRLLKENIIVSGSYHIMTVEGTDGDIAVVL